jgi:hypothetical protein
MDKSQIFLDQNRLSREKEDEYVKFFLKSGLENRLDFWLKSTKHFDKFFKNIKNLNDEMESLARYSSLLFVIRDELQKKESLHKKSIKTDRDRTPTGSIINETTLRIVNKPNKKKKSGRPDKVASRVNHRMMEAIIQLRKTNPPTSWQKVSEYCYKEFKGKKISRQYLRQVYNKYMDEKN